MKISSMVVAAMLSLFVLQVHAQEAPKGFKKGSIASADGTNLSGYVKDNIRSSAAVVFTTEAGTDKKTYSGSELTSVEIEGTKYICVKGDFFKVLCEGGLSFIQKASDASGKPVSYTHLTLPTKRIV